MAGRRWSWCGGCIHSICGHVVPTQYYGYWDFGKVWSEDPAWVGSESLSSAGVGAHLEVAKDLPKGEDCSERTDAPMSS